MAEAGTCQLTLPNVGTMYAQIRQNARHRLPMLQPHIALDHTVLICGAGPSLRDLLDQWPLVDEVWACNSALPYLADRGMQVTHGFAIHQGDTLVAPGEWDRTFDVTYYVASSLYPPMLDRLVHERRRVAVFHSFLGLPDPVGWDRGAHDGKSYEMALYTDKHLFETGVQVGHGLNSVPRAVCLALGLGFRHIYVAGADCACPPGQPLRPDLGTPEYADWMRAVPMYADGRTAAVFGVHQAMAEGVVNGRRWVTLPDMVISARALLDLERTAPERVHLLGDTLPNALKGLDLCDMPYLSAPGVISNFHQEAA